MCGLCGVYGHIDTKAKEAFVHLQMFSQMRGMDSTGVAIMTQKGNVDILKSVGGVEMWRFDHDKKINRWNSIISHEPLALLGHHRAATSGVVNEENAHPFEFDNIVGCHNGTILKHDMIKLASHSHSKIDSEILLEEIDYTCKEGSNEKVSTLMNKIPGAWALTWLNKNDCTLNIARNEKRGLYFTTTVDEKTMFWASEPWMLHVAMNRCDIKWSDKVFKVTPQKHLIFSVGKEKKVYLSSQEKIEEFKPVTYHHPYRQIPSPNQVWPNRGDTPPAKKENKKDKKEKGTNVVPIRTGKDTFQEDYTLTVPNNFIHRSMFMDLVSRGCQWCGCDLGWDDRNEIYWFDKETPLCATCEATEFKDESNGTVDAARKVH